MEFGWNYERDGWLPLVNKGFRTIIENLPLV